MHTIHDMYKRVRVQNSRGSAKLNGFALDHHHSGPAVKCWPKDGCGLFHAKYLGLVSNYSVICSPQTRRTFHGGTSRRLHTDNPSGLPLPRLNYRDLSQNVAHKQENALSRKAPIDPEAIQRVAGLYAQRKEVSSAVNAARHQRSLLGDRIRDQAAHRAKDPQAFQAVLDEAKELKLKVPQLEKQLAEVEDELLTLALSVPNDTHPDVPKGPEDFKKVLSTHGPPPVAASPQRDHLAIGRKLGLLDLEAAATVTGSSWYYLTNEGALLETALTSYALAAAIRRGFTPVTTPDVVRSDVAARCGFHPRDADGQASNTMYHVAHDLRHPPEHVLAGTAEIPLAGKFANKVLRPQDLPARLVGLGRAFRPEAGASGTDTRGLFRVHQFTKVELFVVTKPEQSGAALEELKTLQTEIFEGLGLTFQYVLLGEALQNDVLTTACLSQSA
jgi:seryl-tRNA synthetase